MASNLDVSSEYNLNEGLCKCICTDKAEEKPAIPADSSTDSEIKKHECACCLKEADIKERIAELPLKDYMEFIVTPMISDGFQAVLQKIPPDPVTFLKDFYQKQPNKCKHKIPKHM